LKNNQLLVYEPAAHPSQKFVAGLQHNLASLSGEGDWVLAYHNALTVESLPVGILLSGRNSDNYCHWLIEYLPRLWTIDQDPSFDCVPLIVFDEMPRQHFEVLEILNKKQRPIHRLQRSALTKCRKLIVPSFQTYIV